MISKLCISALPADGSLSDEVWDADVLLALISAQRGRDRFGEVFFEDVLLQEHLNSGERPETEDFMGNPLFEDEWELLSALFPTDANSPMTHTGDVLGDVKPMIADMVAWVRSLSPVSDSARC